MDSGSRRVRREAALVAVGMALLYLLTATSNHAEAEDAVTYARGIADGEIGTVLHPHHLLWGVLAWLSNNVARVFGHEGDPMRVVQAQNALIGGIGIGLMWWWLRSIRWPVHACALACGLLGFSFGYWFYSGEFEVYVLSATLLVCCLAAAHRAALAPSVGRFALLGAVNGAAVLAHDTNVLFAAVTVAALLVSRRGAPWGAVVRRGAAYAAVAAAVVVPAYTAAALANDRETPAQAYDWIAEYAQSGQWGEVEASSLPEAVVGSGRTLVGGHFVFAIDGFSDWFRDQEGRNPRKELFELRNYPDALAVGLLVLLVAMAVAVAVAAAGAWRARRDFDRSQRALVVMCVAWAVVWALFFTWWEPENTEFWIAWWIPLALLLSLPVAAATGSAARRARVLVPVLVGTLAVVNFAGGIVPAQSEANDYWRARTGWYARETTPRDLVVVFGYAQWEYVRYLTRAETLDVEELVLQHGDPAAAAAAALAAIDRWDRDRVFVSRELIDPAADPWSNCGGGEQCRVAAILKPLLVPRSRVVHRDRVETVYEVLRPPVRP